MNNVATVPPPISMLGGKVLIKLDNEDDRIPGSVIIKPEYSVEKPWSGIVMSYGPGRHKSTGVFEAIYDIKVGERVILNRYSGYTVKHDNVSYQVVDWSDVLCSGLAADMKVE